MKYKAVVFDLYGTLVGNFSSGAHQAVLREMAAIVGAPPDEFVRLWFASYDQRAVGEVSSPEQNIELICRRLGVPATADRIARAGRLRREFTKRGLEPWPDTIETLTSLKRMGYKLALISDCSSETPALWQGTEMASLIDVPVFSCDVGTKKPDPQIYLMVTAQLRVGPGECLYVGDGSSDELEGAARVGMHPVMIRSPLESPDAHRIHEEEWTGKRIASLREVLDLVN